jgi:dihydroorotate dehydrogenase (fumarate)
VDLTTQYLGMTLKSPLVPSASPLSRKLDTIRRLEDAGAAAIVMHSLFEEQIALESEELNHYLNYSTDAMAEALSFYPAQKEFHVGPDEYVDNIRKAKEAVKIPIIGSLNGFTPGGWISYARAIEQAGADALELNVYFIPTDPQMDSTAVEAMVLDVVKAVRKSVHIPLAVKLSPYFSATAHMAGRIADAGADGLVLFNRFYQPDFDLENLDVVPSLNLSTSAELRLPLRWIAILYGRLPVDLALSTGVHTHEDVLKALMAGANVAMIASELLQNGIERLRAIETNIVRWMEEHGYESVKQMQGSMSQKNVAAPAAFERANYMRILQSWRPDPTGRLLR